MPRKKCGFGFSCATMMMQPGLEAGNCPNYETCGSVTELTEEEEVELIRVRVIERQEAQVEWERYQETIRLNRRQAAMMMLLSRGCSQNLESLGISARITAVEEQLEQLRSFLTQYEGPYIAPEEVEAHRYNVKRPGGIYWYNKLTAKRAIFEPSEQQQKVKVIHLSHDDDPRNLEGRLGIERRNRLLQIKRQLEIAETALQQAAAMASDNYSS